MATSEQLISVTSMTKTFSCAALEVLPPTCKDNFYNSGWLVIGYISKILSFARAS